MPHLIFKGINKEKMVDISNILPKKLSPLFGGVPDNWFFLEHIDVKYYYQGVELENFPIVQINWYDKGPQVKEEVVSAINEVLEKLGYKSVKMFFINLDSNSFFVREN